MSVGFSKVDDSYSATKEAIGQALNGFGSKRSGLIMIYYAGEYDPHAINRAMKESFPETEYIGGSTDAVIYKAEAYPNGIVVACMYSDYLHFGVASVDNISKDPYEIAQKTAGEAVKKIGINPYVDSYMAFSRMKKGDFSELIRIPSFFVFCLTRGFQPKKMGNEDLIIQGVAKKIGYYIPMFGGSLGNNMDYVFNNTPYDVYTFHSGKIMKDGLVVVFVATGLKYSYSIGHGAAMTKTLGYISEVKSGGFVVSKISGQPILDWYSKSLGVTKEKFTKKLLYYTQKFPIGFPDGYGNIVLRAGGVPAGNDLAYIAPLKENTPIFVMNVENDKELTKVNRQIHEEMQANVHKKIKPMFTFVVSCSSRRRVLSKENYTKELIETQKLTNAPLFGFCSFGEIGSKPAESTHFNHLCTNLFNVYDKLLSE